MRVIAYLLSIFCIVGVEISAFGQSELIATVDAEEVLEGNYFQISFHIKNTNVDNFIPPSFADFEILSGPNRSSQISIINGKSTQSLTYSFNLLPKKIGLIRIGRAKIISNGQTITSNETSIKVLKNDKTRASVSSSNGEKDIFVEVELSDSVAYVGQQMALKYVLYANENVRSYNFITESDYQGFFKMPIDNYIDQPKRVVINGQQLIRRVIKVVYLYPQKSGNLTIDPAQINIGIAIQAQRPSFFYSASLKTERTYSPQLNIQVKSLPPNAPPDFCGGVGKLSMSYIVDKTKISIDDAISLKMKIDGNGLSEFIDPPDQNMSEFEWYDPNVIDQNMTFESGEMKFSKTFEYIIVPKSGGTFQFTPSMSYFDIDSLKYVAVEGRPVQLFVNGEKYGQKESKNHHESVDNLEQIFYESNLKNKESILFGFGVVQSIWLGFVSLWALGLVFIKVKNEKEKNIDIKEVNYKKAHQVASNQLKSSEILLNENKISEFYASLKNAILQYIESKSSIITDGLTRAELMDHLKNIPIAEKNISDLNTILNRSEMALYANMKPDGAHSDFELAKDLISSLENQINK